MPNEPPQHVYRLNPYFEKLLTHAPQNTHRISTCFENATAPNAPNKAATPTHAHATLTQLVVGPARIQHIIMTP